jgi:S1-C subfamily serine protease
MAESRDRRQDMKLRLHSADGEPHEEVVTDGMVLGRGEDADIALSDPRASRRHAQIAWESGRWVVRDLGSSNGTLLDEQPVEGSQPLVHGSVLRIGGQEIEVVTAAVDADATILVEPTPPRLVLAETTDESDGHRTRLGTTTMLRDMSRTMRRVVIGSAVAVIVALAVAVAAVAGVFSPDAASAADIVRQISASTVMVAFRPGPDGEYKGAGTGWVLDAEQGLIVTNGHVAELGNLGVVLGGKQARPARIVAMHRCADVALLQVSDRRGLKTMPAGSQRDLEPGDDVVAVGFPSTVSERSGTTDAPLVTTTGTVSVVKDRLNGASGNAFYTNVIQTDAAINGGNSGGPLIDRQSGRIIGMNTLGANEKQNQNYAVAIDRIRELVPDLARGVSHGWLGLALEDADEADVQKGLTSPWILSVSNPDLTRAGVVPPTSATSFWRLEGVNHRVVGDPDVDPEALAPTAVGHCAASGARATGQPVVLRLHAPDGRTIDVSTRMQ